MANCKERTKQLRPGASAFSGMECGNEATTKVIHWNRTTPVDVCTFHANRKLAERDYSGRPVWSRYDGS